jgi:integrase
MPGASKRPRLAGATSRGPFVLYRPVNTYKGRLIQYRNWWVRFSAPEPDGRSKQFRVGLGTQDLDAATQKAWQLVSDHKARQRGTRNDPVISEFLLEYRKHLKASTEASTARNQWYTIAKFFRESFPDWSQSTLSAATTRRIADYIQDQALNRKASPWTLYDVRKCLSVMFNYAQSHFAFSGNPASDVKVPRIPQGPVEHLAKEQIDPLLKLLKEQAPPLLGPVAIAIYAGLRRAEVTWLCWKDVDLDRRHLSINFKIGEGVRHSPKTNKARVVPISEDLFSIIKSIPKATQWVFSSPGGHRWNGANLASRLADTLRPAGLKYTFQIFRHTFGSLLAQKGLSLYQISVLMGNSEEVCRRHYAALLPSTMHAQVRFQ